MELVNLDLISHIVLCSHAIPVTLSCSVLIKYR